MLMSWPRAAFAGLLFAAIMSVALAFMRDLGDFQLLIAFVLHFAIFTVLFRPLYNFHMSRKR
ncbi:hypothetical protein EB810_06865 [Altererythrobacter sp. FM1]|uniref:hypothetical protein n=1 Tax=Tsuneonella flava TaxID=2055955 RepID=UPI000C801881|nr:hypothetical protein [Tsuneonella flava]ROT94869.1 hypothetical protein EB810_06865 [Altererythrobacter sp. FM1]